MIRTLSRASGRRTSFVSSPSVIVRTFPWRSLSTRNDRVPAGYAAEARTRRDRNLAKPAFHVGRHRNVRIDDRSGRLPRLARLVDQYALGLAARFAGDPPADAHSVAVVDRTWRARRVKNFGALVSCGSRYPPAR